MIDKLAGLASLRKITKGLAKDIDNSGQLERNLESLVGGITELVKSTSTLSKSGESETHLGIEGDIKINKTGLNKYDFLIRGEDGWHKDNNSSFGPLDKTNTINDPPVVNQSSGTFDYSYEGNNRLSINLDTSVNKTGAIATPTIKGYGHLKIESTGTTILQSALRLSSVAASASDTDKFLNIDSSGNLGYRTGAQLLADLGISSGEIIDWTSDQGSTNIHTGNYTDTNTTYSEATGSAEGLMSIAHHDKLDAIEASADVTDATNVTSAGALMDSELSDLAGVKGVTISTLQVNPSEGAFANGDKTKLDGIEDNATADQTRADVEGLSIRETGPLSSGSITSGFGAIDNGASAITTTGIVTTGNIAAGSSSISTTGVVSAGSFNHFMDVKLHMFVSLSSSAFYIPFGPSGIEGTSTATSADDDTLFIAPYDGTLVRIQLQSDTDGGHDAGSTTIALRVNGTTQTAVTETIADDTTELYEWSANNVFSAGDRIRIAVDPTRTVGTCTMTSVWKYTI